MIYFTLRIRLREVGQVHLPAFALPIAPSLAGSTALHINHVSPFRRLLNGFLAALYAVDFVAVIVGFLRANASLPPAHPATFRTR
jgi:hypothetical protein